MTEHDNPASHMEVRQLHAHAAPLRHPDDDLVALWQRIECPVLIVNSRQGYPHRIGQDDTLRRFQNVTLQEIDDAGHWTHHDQLDSSVGAV